MAARVLEKITLDVLTVYTMALTAGAFSFAAGVMGGGPVQLSIGLWLIVSVALMVARRLTVRGDPRDSLTANIGLDGWAARAIFVLGVVALVAGFALLMLR